jgi:formate dehydrogenase major subunit
MVAQPPHQEFDQDDMTLDGPEDWATGLPAIVVSMKRAQAEMGVVDTARSLLKLNHTDGFDCPGCAWPDPDPAHRKTAEFCENGAKHVAAEATHKRVTPEFFATHPVSELAERSDWWLEEQGRITEPMIKDAGSDHYRAAGWDEALDLVATELRALDAPDQASFYTSGRASNEAAFTYQLFARAFGTNNLPDCSNMCHESSGAALSETIGSGKGSVTLLDIEGADLLVLCGQNPGTNHPRMLTHLEVAKQRGAHIVAVNPLPEAGLMRFKNPQKPKGIVGRGTALADQYLPVRLAGDQALFVGIGKVLLEAESAAPGTVLDADFIARHTSGFEAYTAATRAVTWADIEQGSGLGREAIEELGQRFAASRKTIVCWAMGLTQHRNSVATIREIVNVLLLQGNIGKPGAGVCPVRGHSNVQGDRTMGIWEQMDDGFLDALRDEFGFEPPRPHGHDSVDTIAAVRDGRVKVLMSLGGNLVRAMSDSVVTEAAMRRLRLTVSVATKLNRGHTVTGEVAVILPCLGRSERDLQAGVAQAVTVEDSSGSVHASIGRLPPPSRWVRSEVSIICDMARRTVGGVGRIDWADLGRDYSHIRDHVAHVVPGFEAFNEKVAVPGGFLLPHAARDSRTFHTSDDRAHFTVTPLSHLEVPPGCLVLQTIRSHDQYNTSVYGYNDRYRGVHGGRDLVFVNPDDLAHLGLADGAVVDVVTQWSDGVERKLGGLRVVAYPTARQCAAAYYPEANVLIPLDSVADGSNTPTSKSVVVRLVPVGA